MSVQFNPAHEQGQQEKQMTSQQDEMKAKLESAGLAFDRINVFGGCVHVQCIGRDTANKWAALLGHVFAGSKVRLVPSMWEASANKGTVLTPTMRKGFLVGVTA